VLIIGLGAWAVIVALTRHPRRDEWSAPSAPLWGPGPRDGRSNVVAPTRPTVDAPAPALDPDWAAGPGPATAAAEPGPATMAAAGPATAAAGPGPATAPAEPGPATAAAGVGSGAPPPWTAGVGSGVPPLWGSGAPSTTYERVFGDLEMAGPMTLGPTRFSTVFGEIRLDLTAAVLPEGETHISVGTVFGEVRVLLPPGVGARVRAGTAIGEVEVLGRRGGAFFVELEATTEDWDTAPQRMKLDVRTVLGEVAVRRARAESMGGGSGSTGS
jgi:hypothetical protein